MKKILLGSTVLVGAAALFAGAAFAAETPKVTVGGFADFQAAYADQDNDTTQRHSAFRSDTEVTLRIDGKTDGGLQYGGGIDLEADTSDEADSQGVNASKTFVYVGGMWGRVEGGSTTGAATALKIDASRIARATGGIDGDFTYFLNNATAAASTQVIATPDLPLDYGFNGTFAAGTTLGNEALENANKISYYTPRFSGFQAGVSYLVDTNRGQTVSLTDTTGAGTGGVDNIWEAGLSYEGKFSDVGVALAATATRGDATASSGTEDLHAWNVGGKLAYRGWSVAGSYGDWGDSLRTASSLDDSDYWTAGVAYETGPFGASVTYLDSNFEGTAGVENEFTNLSVGVDYKLAPGFTPYAEVSFVEYDPSGTSDDNDATIFIAGTQLSF